MSKQELVNIINPFLFANEIFGEVEEEKLPACTYIEKYLFIDYVAQSKTGIHIHSSVITHDFNGDEYKFRTNGEFCKSSISKEHKDYICTAY